MQRNRTTLGPLKAAQLAAIVAALAPYRNEPLTPAVLELARRIAFMETAR